MKYLGISIFWAHERMKHEAGIRGVGCVYDKHESAHGICRLMLRSILVIQSTDKPRSENRKTESFALA